ncbi:MAG TPA: hypothetical protein VKA45_06270, partial [Gaiellaceae bacterium]|nr:hypothetical protein [Gaiellaceae bacterium]
MSDLLTQTTMSKIERDEEMLHHTRRSATATPQPVHGRRHRHSTALPTEAGGKKSGVLLFVLLIAQ